MEITSTKSVSEFDLGMLVSDVRHLQEDMKEVKGRLASMNERQQSNFRWMIGVVAVPLYLAVFFGVLARLLGLI